MSAPTTLEELERDLARDLSLVAYPGQAWVPPREQAGEPVLDVLIVGAGQGGLAVASLLLRERVTNLLVVDEAPEGEEGIWMRYARMETLRTPKFIGGPDLGLPSLSFQAWYEAQFGAAAFAAIKYIPKGEWQRYLGWFRRVMQIPVRNGTRFLGVAPAEDGPDAPLRIRLQQGGDTVTVLARKLVLAAGIESSGHWWMPEAIAALPKPLRAHAADAIDFSALRGKRVVVVGAAASAFDNAATALEHGAASVTLLCRRAELQRVQPYKVLAYAGFLRHFGALDDTRRWALMGHLLTIREALTRETWDRVTRHAAFSLLTGAPVEAAEVVPAGAGLAVRMHTPQGPIEADFVICGTGFETDLHARPELAGLADQVATWGDRLPEGVAHGGRLGRYPYLDEGMAFVEKVAGSAPWVRQVHCFNFGATMSFGPSGSSISAMKFSVPRLVHALTRSLFVADAPAHARQLMAYDTPEFELVFARDRPSPAA